MLHILKTRDELGLFLKEQRMRHRSVGLVTTMGALHKGHLSLIARSKEENEFTLCSIFVNPTQFNDPADLERYPRPIERDVEALCTAGCDALFLPEVSEMYPPEEEKQGVWHLDIGPLEEILEGAFRPGHYQGVTQVVHKFFKLIKPDRAYFGQKDFQQFLVISRMVHLLEMPVELICCPTLREPDGLAMSSRNIHLSPAGRKEATLLSKALFLIKDIAPSMHVPGHTAGETKMLPKESILSPEDARLRALDLLATSSMIRVEYLEIADASDLRSVKGWEDASSVIALAAILVGQTRLIDNVFIKQW